MNSPRRLAPLDLLADLVAFDTESTKSNLPLIDYVETYLRSWGVEPVRLLNAAGDKAALLVTIGPKDKPGIVLSGHTDVVPVEGQEWSADPFRLRVENGRAYGRGAVDMKGFAALVLAQVPDWTAAQLTSPIHIVLSYDEETTCLGVIDAIGYLKANHLLPKAVIVGEPTGMLIADAHKSVVTFDTVLHGREAHSAKPNLGANAVMAAGDLITELNRMAADMEARGDASGRFDPPYTTVHIGRIHGGTARNILPKTCTIEWEFRGLPDLDPEELPKRLAAVAERTVRDRLNRFGDFGRAETTLGVSVPPLRPEPDSPAARLAMRLAGRNETVTVSFATEGGHFQSAGMSTVICGPGSINQAHQADEYITLEQFAAGEAFMKRLTQECCG